MTQEGGAPSSNGTCLPTATSTSKVTAAVSPLQWHVRRHLLERASFKANLSTNIMLGDLLGNIATLRIRGRLQRLHCSKHQPQ